MKSLSRWLITAVATTGLVLVIPGTAVATPMSMSQSTAATSPQSNTALTLSVQSVSATSDNLTLSGQLDSAASGQKITFFVQTQEFSSLGWMAVGSAVSNSSGEATYTYTPTWTGTELFGAGLGATDAVTTPSVTHSFQVLRDPTGVPQSAIEYTRPLSATGGVFVKSLLTIVAVVWILLLGSLALVIRRMPRLAGVSTSEPGQKGRD